MNKLTVFSVDYEKRTTTLHLGVHDKKAILQLRGNLGSDTELLVMETPGGVNLIVEDWATVLTNSKA